jgi:hypothetical protein
LSLLPAFVDVEVRASEVLVEFALEFPMAVSVTPPWGSTTLVNRAWFAL